MTWHSTVHGIHGTIFTAIAWEILLDELDPKSVDIDKCFPSEEEMKPLVYQAFEWIKKDTADECWKGYQKKLANWKSNRDKFEALLENWDEFKKSAKLWYPRNICVKKCTQQVHRPGTAR